jgi:mannose-1-phosphate guanylyltransferase
MMSIKSRAVGVILAGGEGKRLRPLSYYFQKCMIPVGNRQKPLLEYILRFLKHHNVLDIKLLVGYKYKQIMNYFGNGSRFGVNLTYVQDTPSVKGTGEALLNVYRKSLINTHSPILIYYGDILSDINITEMLVQHRKENAAATLALARGYSISVGVADIKGNTVTGWSEKPTLDLHAGIGILALNPKFLSDLKSLSKEKKDLDITRDFVPYLIEKGENVKAYVTDSFWYDVGSTEKYEKIDNGKVGKIFDFLFSSS